MTTARRISRARPGWSVRFYIGCDTDDYGNPLRSTADRVRYDWRATRDAIEAVPYPEGA